MSPVTTQDKVPGEIQFSHLTSSPYTSDTAQQSNWLTEVFSSSSTERLDLGPATELTDKDFETSSTFVKGNFCKKREPSAVSFVNVTGPPTKHGRNQARKLATVARKREKKERVRREEREAILTALSIAKDSAGPTTKSETSSISPAEPLSSPEFASISWFGGSRSDPFVKYPFELSHRERRLMDHIFHVECGTLKPYKEAFLPVGLSDPAAFHQVLANLAVQLANRHPGLKIAEYEKTEVVAHHTSALAIIHKRLSNLKEATSQGTVATIIAMHLTKDLLAWHAHIKGLRYILSLQQDLQSVGQFRSLRIGFYGLDTLLGPALSWVDTNGSATQDLPPQFPLSPYASQTSSYVLPYPISPAALRLSLDLLEIVPSGTTVFDLFKDTARFAAIFNDELKRSSLRQIGLDPMWPWTNLYPLAHNLLSYRASVDIDDYDSVVKESCRLALNIFVTHARRQFGVAPLVLDIYVDKLLPLLRNPSIPEDWGRLNEFKLWALVIGAMESREETRKGLVAMLKRVTERLEIKTHLSLLEKMDELIWVPEIDAPRFWELESEVWESST